MKKINQPEVKIFYNKFLDPLAMAYSLNDPRWKDWTPPEVKDVKKKVVLFNKEWKKTEKKVLNGMTEALSLMFKRNFIDVHVVRGLPRGFSNPIVLKSGYEPKDFVDVVMHEMIHSLLQQNNDIASWNCVNWIKELYPDESNTVRNHLVVHAVLKYIYIDILKDESRLKRNIERSLKHSIYSQ